MPVNNHRGNISVSSGFLNERAAQLKARSEALSGEYFDPEEDDYDLAFGPKDRTIRPGTMNARVGASPHDLSVANAEERRMEGNN